MSPTASPEPLDWRETRRLRAWELHQQGWSQAAIAAELGVTQGAVSQWLKRVREGDGGTASLRKNPVPGRRTALTAEQLSQLPLLIARGAESYGFQGNQWTTSRVAVLLKQQFGVSYHPAHVSRLLRKYSPNWQECKKG
ncbi:MAG: helix-turn-helix domain-containing protein [Anaerolineaceae bacterium]|nr:helix-turn-helix domain-containing protein [Anaerolineaceae bacterium]